MKKWLISGVAFCMVFGLTGCDFETKKTTEKVDDSNSTSNISTSNTNEKKQQNNIYKIGDKVKVTTDNGSYNITFTKLESTTKREEWNDKKANDVILLAYEIENIDYKGSLSVNELLNFKVYDKSNNACEEYSFYDETTKLSQEVTAGRKSNGIVAYAINDGNKYAELEYFDNFMDDNYTFKLVLEW